MTEKPAVLVTRKLPEAVEARLARDFDARLNPDDRSYGSDELIARAEGAMAIIPCHTDAFTADVIARLPDSVKAICNFSVGYNHVDVEAARKHGLIVTNTPDVLSDATAEIAMLCLLGASRRAAEGMRLGRRPGRDSPHAPQARPASPSRLLPDTLEPGARRAREPSTAGRRRTPLDRSSHEQQESDPPLCRRRGDGFGAHSERDERRATDHRGSRAAHARSRPGASPRGAGIGGPG